MCDAMAALEAVVQDEGHGGTQALQFAEFKRRPRDSPHLDTYHGPGGLITAVDLPARGFAEHHAYIKVRDRHSYAFALVSVAAALEMDDGRISEARLALGGVAHRPWRVAEAEALLCGQPPAEDAFRRAGAA